jgi:hypothetical protein
MPNLIHFNTFLSMFTFLILLLLTLSGSTRAHLHEFFGSENLLQYYDRGLQSINYDIHLFSIL